MKCFKCAADATWEMKLKDGRGVPACTKHSSVFKSNIRGMTLEKRRIKEKKSFLTERLVSSLIYGASYVLHT